MLKTLGAWRASECTLLPLMLYRRLTGDYRQQLRRTHTKYLEDVHQRADTDYDGIIALIEKRKAAYVLYPYAGVSELTANLTRRDQNDGGFLNTIDAILSDTTQADTTEACINNVQSLLSATDALLQLNQKANNAISASSTASTGPAAYVQTCAEDQERVREILASGKRVFEGELEAVQQQARSDQAGGKGEAAAQAIALFGDGAQGTRMGADASKTMEYIERGVKRMTKGLDGVA